MRSATRSRLEERFEHSILCPRCAQPPGKPCKPAKDLLPFSTGDSDPEIHVARTGEAIHVVRTEAAYLAAIERGCDLCGKSPLEGRPPGSQRKAWIATCVEHGHVHAVCWPCGRKFGGDLRFCPNSEAARALMMLGGS